MDYILHKVQKILRKLLYLFKIKMHVDDKHNFKQIQSVCNKHDLPRAVYQKYCRKQLVVRRGRSNGS